MPNQLASKDLKLEDNWRKLLEQDEREKVVNQIKEATSEAEIVVIIISRQCTRCLQFKKEFSEFEIENETDDVREKLGDVLFINVDSKSLIRFSQLDGDRYEEVMRLVQGDEYDQLNKSSFSEPGLPIVGVFKGGDWVDCEADATWQRVLSTLKKIL